MRLYPKRLRNIEDLEREKKALAKQMAQLDTAGLFSMDSVLEGMRSGKKSKGDDSSGMLGNVLEMLPISNPLVSIAVKFIQARLSAPSKPKKKVSKSEPEEEPSRPGIVKRVAFEVITGYLKWKAIELSYKGVKHLMKKNKAKRARRSQAAHLANRA